MFKAILGIFRHFFSRNSVNSVNSDLTSDFLDILKWDVDILSKDMDICTTDQIDFKDVDILHKRCGYTTNIRIKDMNCLIG